MKMQNMWTEERLRQEAMKYSSRNEFSKANQYAYRRALDLGILDELGFPNKLGKWTREAIFAEAKKYSSKSEFLSKNRYAVLAARKMGVYDQACSHMVMAKASVNYLLFFGGDIYKTGVSSEAALRARIEKIENASGLKVCDTVVVHHHQLPRSIETLILYIGRPVQFDRPFDGSGEFRHFTEMEKALALKILRGGSDEG